jgi:hypothetical protein
MSATCKAKAVPLHSGLVASLEQEAGGSWRRGLPS